MILIGYTRFLSSKNWYSFHWCAGASLYQLMRAASMCLFQTPCSVTSNWYFKIDHGERISKIGKSYQQRLFTFISTSLTYLNQMTLKVSCMLSHIQLFMTLWTIACQGALSMGFSRQKYWSGLPFPPLGDLFDPGIKPMFPESLALQAIHTAEPLRSQLEYC